MKVSVIIPTYNEEDVIGECLGSLSGQTYKDLEIIVVDDGSTDTTSLKLRGAVKTYNSIQEHSAVYCGDELNADMSPSFGGKARSLERGGCHGIKVFTQEHKGPGAARNLGAKEAKGEILVFVDADMTFEPDFIEKLVKPISDPTSPKGLRGARGTFSKEEYVSNWDNVWARCWSINKGWEPKRRHPKGYPDKQKVFRAILKSEFDRVGGFDATRGYNDDWSLSEKLGYKADVVLGAVFYHKNPDNLVEIFEQAKWVAKRKYKLGIFGIIYNLLVFSFPDSIWIGFWKALFKKEPLFIVFKIVYDFGIFIGILEYFLFGKVSK